MISCTEFIPCYSALFQWLEDRHGRAEVDRLWKYLFFPDGKGIPLIDYIQKDGLRGCWNFWAEALDEEAADYTQYLNEKRGFFVNRIQNCPSKGGLLKQQEKTGVPPYRDYCLHCDSYRSAVEKAGLCYIFNFRETDLACCEKLISDPAVFDGRIILDADTQIRQVFGAQNEYFHLDFHSSMNMCMEYLGSRHGTDAVHAFLAHYTRTCLAHVIADVKQRGLCALEELLLHTYRAEKAPQVLQLQRSDDRLQVRISACPGITYLRQTGREVSQWFRCTTDTVMETIAADSGLQYRPHFYDEHTGAAEYILKGC